MASHQQQQQQQQQQDEEDELDPTHVIWERKRYYCCFGWRRPIYHQGWVDVTGHSMADRPHPGTREYKLAKEGRIKGKDWEYKILVNEQTDPEGWQYARCLWGQLGKPRPQGRNQERYPDFVRHRKWVHKDHADNVLRSAKRGAVGVLDPVQLARKEQEAQSRYDEGLKSVQELVAQLEENNKLKSMAYSLLDPVAVWRVARNHIKVLRGLQAKALRELKPVMLTPTEVFASELEEQPARRLPSLYVLPPAAGQSAGSQTVVAMNGVGEPVVITESMIAAEAVPSVLAAAGMPGSVILEGSTPSASLAGSRRGSLAPGSFIQPVGSQLGNAIPASVPPGSFIQPVGSHLGVPVGNQLATSVIQANPQAGSLIQVGSAPASIQDIPPGNLLQGNFLAGGINQVTPSGSMLQDDNVVQRGQGRPGSGIWNSIIQRRPGARPGSALQRHHNSMPPMRGGQPGEQSIPRLVHGWGWRRFPWPRRQRPRAVLPGQPERMVLSMSELECATGHALAIYGDIEDYLNAYPRQSYYDAIQKFTGVPEEDVLMAMWRSRPFKPAHYVAVDHRHKKIVVCIRGTFDKYDRITDLVCQPVLHTFGPGLQGFVHHGVLKAGLNIIKRLMEVLQDAVSRFPQYDVLVTGHSLGGGTASLLALLLRYHEVLPDRHRSRLRCVALAPLPAMGTKLARSCQDYVASVIYNWDLAPRLNIHNMSKYLAQVTQASPLRRAIVGVSHAVSKLTDVVHLHKHNKDDGDSSSEADDASPEQAADPNTDALTSPDKRVVGGHRGDASQASNDTDEADGTSPVLSAHRQKDNRQMAPNGQQTSAADHTAAMHGDSTASPGKATALTSTVVPGTSTVLSSTAAPGIAPVLISTAVPAAGTAPISTVLPVTATAHVGTAMPATTASSLAPATLPAGASAFLHGQIGHLQVDPQLQGLGGPAGALPGSASALNGHSASVPVADGQHQAAGAPAMPPVRHLQGRQEVGRATDAPAGPTDNSLQIQMAGQTAAVQGQESVRAERVGSMSQQQLQEQEVELRHALAALQDLAAIKQTVETVGSPVARQQGAASGPYEADATAMVAVTGGHGPNAGQPAASQAEQQAAHQASLLLMYALEHLQQLRVLHVDRPGQGTAQQWLAKGSPQVPPWQQEQDWQQQVTFHEQQVASKLKEALLVMQRAVPERTEQHDCSKASNEDVYSDSDMDSDSTHEMNVQGPRPNVPHQPVAAPSPVSPHRAVPSVRASPQHASRQVPTPAPVTVVYKSVTHAAPGPQVPQAGTVDGRASSDAATRDNHKPYPVGRRRRADGELPDVSQEPVEPPGSTSCAEAAAATHPESGADTTHPDTKGGSEGPVAAAVADVRGAADAADDSNDQPPATTAAADKPHEPGKPFEGAEGTSSDSKVLLQPLEPPGTVFWLVRDTRVKHKRVKLAAAGVFKGLMDFVTSGQTPPPDAMPPAKPVSSQSRGSFMSGLVPGLESTEEEADTPEQPSTGKKDSSSKSKELPVVLLAADATWFSDMWVSMKAISDHGPVMYWKAINQLFEQQRHKGIERG